MEQGTLLSRWSSLLLDLRKYRPGRLLWSGGCLIMLASFWLARSAGAQTLDGTQTLQFCNWRQAMSEEQAAFVASLVPLASQFNSYVTYRGDDPITFNILRECTLHVRSRICTDQLFSKLLDPTPSSKWGPAIGMVEGVVKHGYCNKRIEEVYAPIARRLGPVVLTNLASVSYDSYKARVGQAMRNGAISAAHGSQLLQFTDQIAKAARASR